VSPASKAPDRRARILDAAIVEFAEKGYASASTNAIAAAAGVAKGLVFHHFADKEALFLAVVDQIADRFAPQFAGLFRDAPNDVIGRVLVLIEAKLAYTRAYPLDTRFLLVAMADAPPSVKKKARARLEAGATTLLRELTEGLDASLLRDGVRLEDAIEAVMLLSAGIEKRNEALMDTRAKAQRFDVEAAVAYSRRMLAVLRDGLYRPR
jgi:TetR/AcrR family transcriptional regulator